MAKDEFNLDDPGLGSDSEESLDDFFQPAGSGAEEGAEPSIDDFFSPPAESAPRAGQDSLPIERERLADVKDRGTPGPEAPPVPLGAEEEGEAPSKGFFARNWIVFLVGFLVILVGGVGGYLAVDFFILKPKSGKVAQVKTKKAGPAVKKPVDKKTITPKPALEPKAKEPEAAANKKTENLTPEKAAPTPPEKEKAEKVKPDTAAQKEPSQEPEPAKTAKTAPAATPSEIPKTKAPSKGRSAVASTNGPYTVQVGSYMLAASKKQPESLLKELGYSDYHYVPYPTRLKIYHVLVGKDLSRAQADDIKKQLTDMGYVPEIYTESGGYRVKVYSYGSYSIAKSTRTTVTRAGLSPVVIKAETEDVSLDQLRVGSYASQQDANRALRDLKKNGFKAAVIVKE